MRITGQKTAVMQRLRTILAEWCPQVSKLCKDFNRTWQRALLDRWPLHEDLAAAHGNSINAFLAEHRLGPDTRQKVQTAQKARPIFIPEGRKDAVRFEICLCLDQLQLLISKLDDLDRQLEVAFAAHPCFSVFNSLPVKGLQTLAMITAAFGDRRDDPTGWRQLAARWGVGPVTVSSGKKKLVKRRRACDTHVLQALTDFAFTTAFSVSGCWSFSFYERKRREGRDHHESLRAVALRWVKILWAMWNAGSAYDESYHRRRKGVAASR
jgi:transposase